MDLLTLFNDSKDLDIINFFNFKKKNNLFHNNHEYQCLIHDYRRDFDENLLKYATLYYNEIFFPLLEKNEDCKVEDSLWMGDYLIDIEHYIEKDLDNFISIGAVVYQVQKNKNIFYTNTHHCVGEVKLPYSQRKILKSLYLLNYPESGVK